MSVTEITELPPLAKEVLEYMEIHGPLNQKMLADNLCLERNEVSRAIQTLSMRNLILRDSSNGRYVVRNNRFWSAWLARSWGVA